MVQKPGAAAAGPAAAAMSTTDIALYVIVVLVWGSSWLGMRWQVGVVAPEVSVLWRFSIAFPLMFAWAALAGQPLGHAASSHVYFAAMGATMFSMNLVLFYTASFYIPTGLMAVVFSLASIFNLVLASVFMGQPIRLRMIVAGLIGISGVGLMFAPEISMQQLDNRALVGLGISLVATLCFCTGNIVSAAAQRRGIPVLAGTAWGMLYGAGILLVLALLRGHPLIVEWNFRYFASLLWLAVVASVIAFSAFLTLVGRTGAARAGYMTVLFPVVALAASTFVEGYRWTTLAVAGLALVIFGNVYVLRSGR